MSRIDDLINKLCPDGVQLKKIKEIADVGTGSSNGKDAVENGIFPFFIRSKTVKAKDDYEFDEEAIIIPGEGGIGDIFHYINGKYALHQRAYRIHFYTDTVITKFAYYLFKTRFKDFILRKAVNATVSSIRKPMIEDFCIPIPPLAIQEEIVSILDKFTRLQAELQAELQARVKQFEFYREKLIKDFCYKDITYKHLKDVLTIKNGRDYKQYSYGNVPVYGSGGIMSYIDTAVYNKPSVLIPRKGSLKNLFYVETPFWNVDTIFYTDIDTKQAIPKYVFFYLSGLRLEKLNKAGGVPSLTQEILNKIKIPLPSLSEQQKIVSILNLFDKLCNDIKEGLPAEIEARQKQYEYYRDKLLTFKQKE